MWRRLMSVTTGAPINEDFQARLQRVAGSRPTRSPTAELDPAVEAADHSPARKPAKRSPVTILFSIGVVLVAGSILLAIFMGGATSSNATASLKASVEPITLAPLETRTFDRPSFDIDLPSNWQTMTEARLRALADGDENDPNRKIVAGYEEPTTDGEPAVSLLVVQQRDRDITVSDAAEGAKTTYGILSFLSWFGVPKVEIVEGPDLSKIDGFEAVSLVSRHDYETGPVLNNIVFIDTGYEILELLFVWREGVIETFEIERILATIDVK